MSAIVDLNEEWHGHTGLEVETFLKAQIGSLVSSLGGKFGYAELSQDGKRLLFYDYEGGSELGSVTFSGDLYTVTVTCDLGNSFYVLGSETAKNITMSASTTVGAFGTQDVQPFPEAHSYTMSVDSGSGYVVRRSGVIPMNGEEVIDIRPFVTTGDNYIRFVVTGLTSGQTKTTVITATVTSLWMTCNHKWQTPWLQGESYVINNIRFAGSVEKNLHIAIDGTEIDSVKYNANQSYTSTATTYTISADSFPEGNSDVHTITLWMTAQGISTEVVSINTMCITEGDTTPIICINSISDRAVNFTDSNLFAYAVYNASYAKFNLSALMEGSSVPVDIVTNRIVEATAGVQYPFSVSLEIESEAIAGTLTAVATALDENQTEGVSDMVTMPIDNTYSYLATSGALFYMNPANRSNVESNYQSIINEAEPDLNFTKTYDATWSGMAWATDGWTTDADNHKCLSIPAGCSVVIPDLVPLSYISSYQTGMTIEMMIQAGYPSDYDTPIITMSDPGTNRGITIYPTKIVVLGNNVLNENTQMVNLCENRITHLAITFTKNYSGKGTSFNLCSIYVNGVSNINFSFEGNTTFGSGALKIGAPDVDTYLYKMRIYGKALEAQDVLNNFLNCIIDGVEFTRSDVYAKNDILYGGEIGYEMVKDAGLNTMVIYIPDDNIPLPDIDHDPRPNSIPNCSWKFEYADHPDWNFTVGNVSLDGQGTTSMKYYRWNLRAKTSSSTTWDYESQTMEDSTGKSGYFAGAGYPKVDRITAKKNYASSMQGHKMGLTGLYDDLYTELGLKNELPDSTVNVAVYQFPFVGFRYYQQSGAYEYIGLYTAGPDKSSKVTFGYTSDYQNLLSLEGPNHAPLGTRFLHPWVDVTYSYEDETLQFGGEEGWDCDYVGAGLDTDTAASQAAILGLYESEWRPAYELVYHCSPYIASLASALTAGGYADIAAANADIDNFRAGTTDGMSNSILAFYDSNYDLWFYRTKTGVFENLTTVEGSSVHNILSYLGLTGSPTTAQIKSARAAKFKNEMANYWSVDQALYHYCFCVLLGITDNFAKNSYPFKFNALSASGVGNRWGWRQDDLDTAFITDNNGMQTKSYSVEHGDVNAAGGDIFQGGSSALWMLIRDNYQDELCTMMGRITNAAVAIASRLGILGSGPSGSLFNVISYYCWEQSAKYFSQTLYEKDRVWSYITPWLENPAKQYNGVYPLTQALGDQYQAERYWMERRIAYIFSKYHVGEYTQDKGGSGDIAFTLGQQYTFNPVPAIDMYPVISQGSTDYRATRTEAGDASSNITVPSSTDTTVYIHGADWLSSLGDLHDMVLTTRGGDVGIPFSVTSKRLVELILGAPSGVLFNATSLAVESPTLTKIDARNTLTITNSVSLLNCPRLKEAYFAGSGATGLTLPVGSRITDVSFPDNMTSLYLNQLHMLENVTWPDSLGDIESLYIYDTPAVDAIAMLEDILDVQGNDLAYVTISGDFTADDGGIKALKTIAEGDYGKVVYDGDYSNVAGGVDVEGSLSAASEVSVKDVEIIEQSFPDLEVNIPDSQLYIEFADAEVETVALAKWDTDSNGKITLDEAKAVSSIGTSFRGNTSIETFDELEYFENATLAAGSNGDNLGSFGSCTALRSIYLPMARIPDYAFYNDTALTTVKGNNITEVGTSAFEGCKQLEWIDLHKIKTIKRAAFFCNVVSQSSTPTGSLKNIDLSNVESVGRSAFCGQPLDGMELNMPKLTGELAVLAFQTCNIAKIVSLGNITSLGVTDQSTNNGTFRRCASLIEVHLPVTLTAIGEEAFRDCSAMTSINIEDTQITSISTSCFHNCTSLPSITLPNTVTSIGNRAFQNCSSLVSIGLSLSNVTIGDYAFYNCSSLASVNISNAASIKSYAFKGCKVLSSIDFSKVTSIGSYAFEGCTGLNVEVDLPSTYVCAINTNGEFRGSGVTKVKSLGSSSWINGNLFENCKSLTFVRLPETLNGTIWNHAFSECTSLTTLICLAETPPVVSGGFNDVFKNCPLTEIFVPDDCVQDYKNATDWTSKASIIKPLSEYTGTD